MIRLPTLLLVLATWALSACTDSELYGQTGTDPLAPDRVTVQGELCTEDASGSKFPVKVLFMIDSSNDMFAADPNAERFLRNGTGLASFVERYRTFPHVRFGFVGIGSTAKAVPLPDGQRFFRATDLEVAQAIAQLQSPLGTQRDMVNAISQAESFITADMARNSPGENLRTRYLVYMLLAGPPDPAIAQATLAAQVERLRNTVQSQGALEFRLDIGMLYYGPRSIDAGETGYDCYPAGTGSDPSCACDPGTFGSAGYCSVFCAIDAGLTSEADNDTARTLYRGLSFTGAGAFREFRCPTSINYDVGVTTSQVQLVKKDIVAINTNVRLTGLGPTLDSDGDGMTDIEELGLNVNTDPTLWDTDGDGLGDRLELRAAPEQNPLDASDRPLACVDPATAVGLPDRDLDLLNDCEEGVLQTSPTIPDTDGDGLPDFLEFQAGTVPTSAEDRLLDFDGDGAANAEEVLEHTNPRASDSQQRATFGYRNSITPLGLRNIAVMEDPEELPGITFRTASAGVVGGPSFLRWNPCDATLEWRDARGFAAVPVDIVPGPQVVTARAQLTAEGELVSEIWVELDVVPELLPTCETGEVLVTPLITVSERRCYDMRISNIKLLQTRAANGEEQPGLNRILVFFTQAPEDRLSSPGISKVAEVRVRFLCDDPDDMTTCGRNPFGLIELNDSMFVSAVP